MAELVLNHLELAEIVWKCKEDIGACVQEIASKHTDLKAEDLRKLKTFLTEDFVPDMQTRWESVRRDKTRFRRKFAEWLKENKTIIVGEQQPEAGPSTACAGARAKAENPEKAGGDGSSKLAQREQPKPRGSASASKRPPAKSSRRSVTHGSRVPNIPLDMFLALQLQMRASDHQFKRMMSFWKVFGNPPSFEELSRAKEECLPSNVEYSDYWSRVTLQDLLDHTVRRILLSLPPTRICRMPTELTLTSKWGYEGAGDPNRGRKMYLLEHFWDYGLFLTAVAPMKLESSGGNAYFENTREDLLPSCRPQKLMFFERSLSVIREEKESIEKEISELKPSEVEIGGKKFVVKHVVILTEREKRGRSQQSSAEAPQESPLPLRDLCEEAMGMGEGIMCDMQDERQKNCHPTANHDVFRTLLAASDPYFLARQ